MWLYCCCAFRTQLKVSKNSVHVSKALPLANSLATLFLYGLVQQRHSCPCACHSYKVRCTCVLMPLMPYFLGAYVCTYAMSYLRYVLILNFIKCKETYILSSFSNKRICYVLQSFITRNSAIAERTARLCLKIISGCITFDENWTQDLINDRKSNSLPLSHCVSYCR